MPRFDPDSAIDRETEARTAEKVARRERISKNVNTLHEQRLSIGQRMADRMA